jgi:hypothetical protein
MIIEVEKIVKVGVHCHPITEVSKCPRVRREGKKEKGERERERSIPRKIEVP